MDIVLFVYQTIGADSKDESYCGVGIKGKLISDILVKSEKYRFIPLQINAYSELEKSIIEYNPKVIIYNYHFMTTPWMNDIQLRNKYDHIHHIMIQYDITQSKINNYKSKDYHEFKYIITDDDTLTPNANFFVVTRSIPNNDHVNDTNNDINNSIPIIGFQGFGLAHKGLPRLAERINAEFDEAIIRLHMPYSYYCDPKGVVCKQQIEMMKQKITKDGIKMEITHNFMSDDKIVTWLNANTLNCYFYDYLDGAGIASSPDYAIAAKKPIAVTKSYQMRNFWNLNPSVLIEHNSLKTIIRNGTEPLIPLYQKYSHGNLIKDYENICDRLLNK